MSTNAFDELKWRGLVYDHTEGAPDILSNQKVTVYNGFDPTADSLHIGNLVTLMQLARLQRYGHTPIAIAGGGTGMIGDPSGKSSERTLLSREQIEANLVGIQKEMAMILDFEVKSNPARIINNADWLNNISFMDFLRDVGKHFTVNYMMAKDSVKSRVDRESGISFTEFSYMLLQAYDFLHLFDHQGCTMQTGGSDQWGNITAGVELIRKLRGEKAFGLVYPLITKADGSKFGKTESGTIWLSPQRTSPYRFYQFWLNTDDADVINYLRYFTWLNREEVAELDVALLERPHLREAQRKLAQEVTQLVHGETAVTKAEKASAVLFGGDLDGLDAGDIRDIFADVPSSEVAKNEFIGEGMALVDLLTLTGVEQSKGAAKRAVQGGGIYINNQRVSDTEQVVTMTDSIEGQFMVLRKGKKKYHLVKVLA
ncbi:MAG: tyrosine--tRNA ligase [Ardenticatenaceae bacterium]|nr:tyrosine--tRNA ligase [Ardenticatenaceae bacterium]MCB8990296.1 tyrosine--tRNA ligase [Ardenticatenaceae bacterium]